MRRITGSVLLALALTACSNGASGDAVAITATDTECRVGRTHLQAGDHTFAVRNDGKDVTEVSVYADGDRVVAEQRDIGPGTSADLTASLTAGHYKVACKPGRQGDIRTDLHVSGTGGTAARPAGSTVAVHAKDYAFEGLGTFAPKAGETVTFELHNGGTVEHEFAVFAPDGSVLGEIGPTAKGKAGAVTLTLGNPGEYRYVCAIADHEARGMKGTFRAA